MSEVACLGSHVCYNNTQPLNPARVRLGGPAVVLRGDSCEVVDQTVALSNIAGSALIVASIPTFDVKASWALESINEPWTPRMAMSLRSASSRVATAHSTSHGGSTRPKAAAPWGRLKYLCAYAHTQMTKTISLSEEAYRLLRRHKLANESFSDTVTRLARQGGKLSEVVGLYPELRGRTGLANLVRENRGRLDRRVGAR